MATSYDVSGVLASGGEFHATPSMIEVTYPGTDKPPVAIDLGDVSGVRRRGTEVTLIRGGRETTLRTTELAAAGRLESLVRHYHETRNAEEFEHQLIRLYSQGYQIVALTPKIAQLRKPKKFNFLLAAILALLAVLPALIYVFYYFSQPEQTALVILEDSGEVVVRQV
ncbi:MAG TPA: hypothetical protein VFV93_02135 [Thermomicrobiales bacterium]|nr:hypothetical protein [Thermomicrobiales bacterium]